MQRPLGRAYRASMRSPVRATLLLCTALAACGDDTSASASAGGTMITTAQPTAEPSTTTPVPTTGGDGLTGSGTGTGSEDSGAPTGPGESESDTGVKLDLGVPDGELACGCEFSYVWVANASEGTVSKINMDTLEEEARYLTRADAQGNPSRTSVSLRGDVAVANRHGGLVKFHADIANCKDTNGTPGIQTSTGKDDVLPWDEEECRAWYVDFPTTNQRPVAWTQGKVMPGGCNTTDEKIWTVMSEKKSLLPGLGAPGGVIVALVDGETGNIDKQLTIPTFSGDSFGAYGGAVNTHGDLFFTSMAFNGGHLARVYIDNFAFKVWVIPPDIGPYGITVDHKGQVWLSSVAINTNGVGRFDPEVEKWDFVSGFGSGAGLAEGPNNWMWVSSYMGVNSVHIDTLELGPIFKTDYQIKGLGFDDEGFMWAVNYAATDENMNQIEPDVVMKIDPEALTVVGEYDGLDHPYTYSDFTGNALFNVTCVPPQ